MKLLKPEDHINLNKIKQAFKKFKGRDPFDYCIIENFFKKDVALKLESEFLNFNDPSWYKYNNPIEIKKAMNNWDRFPPVTYSMFTILNSNNFCNFLSKVSGVSPLFSDQGLNGGGWHAHKKGGKLNIHLDYSIHPKLQLERKLNIIIYLNSKWKKSWGGEIGFFSHNKDKFQPKELKKKILPLFNRAVIFDTTQNSWHGILGNVDCPKNEYRKSIAIYYLTHPKKGTSTRGKALFSPTSKQQGDKKILELVKKRSSTTGAHKVWG